MKSVVKLQAYYFPWELEAALRDFVQYYNNERYHESLARSAALRARWLRPVSVHRPP